MVLVVPFVAEAFTYLVYRAIEKCCEDKIAKEVVKPVLLEPLENMVVQFLGDVVAEIFLFLHTGRIPEIAEAQQILFVAYV